MCATSIRYGINLGLLWVPPAKTPIYYNEKTTTATFPLILLGKSIGEPLDPLSPDKWGSHIMWIFHKCLQWEYAFDCNGGFGVLCNTVCASSIWTRNVFQNIFVAQTLAIALRIHSIKDVWITRGYCCLAHCFPPIQHKYLVSNWFVLTNWVL